MSDHMTDLDELFASLTQEVEKVASEAEVTETAPAVENDDTMDKLASDLQAGGEIMANALVNRVLEKLAAAVPAGGGGSEDPIAAPRSNWEAVAARLATMYGRQLAPGDDTSVRAEEPGYPGHGSQSHRSGAHGVVNPQRDLG